MIRIASPWDRLEDCIEAGIPGVEAGRIAELSLVAEQSTLCDSEHAELLELKDRYHAELSMIGYA